MNENIKQQLGDLKRKVAGIKEARAFLKFADTYFADNDIAFRIYAWPAASVVYVKDENQLTAVRKMLRAYAGQWKDSITDISCLSRSISDGSDVSVTYRSNENKSQYIILRCTIGTMPEGIKKPGCGFKEIADTQIEYVCEI